MRILLGAEMKNGSDTDSNVKIYKNAEYTFAKDVQDQDVKFPVTAAGQSDKTEAGVNAFPLEANKPTEFRWINLTNGKRGQQDTFTKTALETGVENRVRFFWEEKAAEGNEAYDAKTLVISPDKYPGTYRVVGDALIRSEKDGHDYAFQFVINKAKLMSEVTLTMQAKFPWSAKIAWIAGNLKW